MKYLVAIFFFSTLSCATNQQANFHKVEYDKDTTLESPLAIKLKENFQSTNTWNNYLPLNKNQVDEEKISVAQNTDSDNLNGSLHLALRYLDRGERASLTALLNHIDQNMLTKKSADADKLIRIYIEGKILSEEGFKEQSGKLFKDALRLDPLFTPAYTELARIYQYANQTNMAEFVLNLGLERIGADPRLYLAMAKLRQEQGRWDESKKWLDQSISERENFSRAYVSRANWYLKHKRTKEAKTDVAKALEVSPKDADTLILAAMIAINSDQNIEKGKSLLGQAIKLNPKKQIAKLRLAEIFMKERQKPNFVAKILQSIVNNRYSKYSTRNAAKYYLKNNLKQKL